MAAMVTQLITVFFSRRCRWSPRCYYSACCSPRSGGNSWLRMGRKCRHLEFGMLGKSILLLLYLGSRLNHIFLPSLSDLRTHDWSLAFCTARGSYMDCRSIPSRPYACYGFGRVRYRIFLNWQALWRIFR